uniref:Ribosomal protein mS38 C-terminal domain-containing protein n=1 Tax=Hyaloperonospora arabidopsidis (strain Emoy2) TaxID=559515 RepID=M4BFG3_HYAAE
MSGVRAVVRSVFSASRRSLQSRAFMSTRAPDTLFETPSFPMPEDPFFWQDKYLRADPSHLWKVGSFPLQSGQADEEEDGVLTCSEDLWDTSGMLSALQDALPLRELDGGRNGDELLRQLNGYLADSVVKKRRKKMNKHKYRKRKKAQRMRTKKN